MLDKAYLVLLLGAHAKNMTMATPTEDAEMVARLRGIMSDAHARMEEAMALLDARVAGIAQREAKVVKEERRLAAATEQLRLERCGATDSSSAVNTFECDAVQ